MGEGAANVWLRALAILAVLALFGANATSARADGDPSYRPIGVSLFEPASIFHGPDVVIVGVSVNAIYGRSRAVYGVELGLFNRVDKDVGVLQLGVLGNWVEGGCYGLCAAGFGNSHGALSGFQLAILANEATRVGAGAQVSFLNVIRRDAGFALQVGFANINNRRLADVVAVMGAKKGDVVTIHLLAGTQRGIQLGVTNFSDNYRGLQLAAVVNVAEVGAGIQVGAANVAGKRYSGIQLGAFNYAHTMRGLQIGVINACKVLRGVQLGGLNIATRNSLPIMVGLNAGF